MTVTLLQPYAAIANGATVTLDNATEAALVAQGRATFTVNPGTSFQPLTPVEQQNLRYIYVGVWSGRPAATSVSVGTQMVVTDVGVGGRSYWWSDGTSWRPANGRVRLYGVPGSVTTPAASFNSGGAIQVISTQPDIKVPAGMMVAGSKITVEALLNRTISGSAGTARIGGGFGTAKSTADTRVLDNNIAGAWVAASAVNAIGSFTALSATKVQSGFFNLANGSNIGTAFATELTYNSAVDNFFTFVIDSLTVADTGVQLVNYNVTLEG
jgi:hypothetical protein